MRRQIMVIPHTFLPFRHSRVRWHAETNYGYSAPFCHPEAAGPMTCGDKLWSFRTPFAIQTQSCPMARRDKLWSFCALLSSRGGGLDDMRRQIMVIPHTFFPFRQSCVRWHAETNYGHSAPFVNRGRQAR